MPEYRDRIFMMILDEINLSKPEHFFADFLAALEQPMGNRRITLVDEPILNAPTLMVEGRHLPIPPNVWFVGTANHDETTAEFADKTYDRAHVMEMPRKTSAAHFDILNKPSRPSISFAKLEHAFSTAADTRASEVQHAITWLNGATFSKTLGDHFGVGWGNRLEGHMARFLPVVVETGGSVGEAMDHLLVTKVFRKLKDRHEFRVASLEKLKDQLLTSWDGLDRANLPDLCFSLIEREILKKQGEEQV